MLAQRMRTCLKTYLVPPAHRGRGCVGEGRSKQGFYTRFYPLPWWERVASASEPGEGGERPIEVLRHTLSGPAKRLAQRAGHVDRHQEHGKAWVKAENRARRLAQYVGDSRSGLKGYAICCEVRSCWTQDVVRISMTKRCSRSIPYGLPGLELGQIARFGELPRVPMHLPVSRVFG